LEIIEKGLDPEFKRRKLKKSLVKSLRLAGMEREAVLMGRCQEEFLAFVSPVCGCVKVAPVSCGISFCPDCGLRRRVRLQEKVRKSFSLMKNPRFLTLTVKNMDRLSGDVLSELKKTFGKLRRTKRWLRYVQGGEYVLEIPWTKAKGWHPHIHVLFDGRYYPQDELAEDWKKAGGGDVVDVRKADQGSAAELCKYISKGHAFVSDPRAVRELFAATSGKRLAGSFGCAFKWNREIVRGYKKEPFYCEHGGGWEYACGLGLLDVFLEDGEWRCRREKVSMVRVAFFDRVIRAA